MLQTFEDELFFAILDVALDIDQALLVQSAEGPVYINGIRDVIRYQLLYPVHAVNFAYRYADLRGKGLLFLQKQSAISSMQFRKIGLAGWEGRWEIAVPDVNRFGEFLQALRIEENRRNPGQKMQTDLHSATARLVQLGDSFDRVALRLRDRRAGREPLVIKDEYDVQYIFAALLETRFDDIRPEEGGPSYAGKAARVDFFLKNESVLFETKMTRDGLTDGKLGEELIIDINHYKQRPECKALVCFVYDPDHKLKNPRGLENDLSRQHDYLSVKVIIRPK
jgi:REase_DpnII-MboI